MEINNDPKINKCSFTDYTEIFIEIIKFTVRFMFISFIAIVIIMISKIPSILRDSDLVRKGSEYFARILVQKIKDIPTMIFNFLKSVIEYFFKILIKPIEEVIEWIKNALNSVKDAFNDAGDWIEGAGKTIVGWFS